MPGVTAWLASGSAVLAAVAVSAAAVAGPGPLAQRQVAARRLVHAAPLFVFNLGTAQAMPALTIRGLDCVPGRRGMGSSVQLFVQTGFNAVIAAILTPLLWGSLMSLALGAATLFLCAGAGVLLAARM